MTLEAQSVCHFCGARHLSICGPERSPGDRVRTHCVDCGWITLQEVTVVYDPDLYDIADAYGPGISLRSRCVDCGETTYGPNRTCAYCDSPRLKPQWERPLGVEA